MPCTVPNLSLHEQHNKRQKPHKYLFVAHMADRVGSGIHAGRHAQTFKFSRTKSGVSPHPQIGEVLRTLMLSQQVRRLDCMPSVKAHHVTMNKARKIRGICLNTLKVLQLLIARYVCGVKTWCKHQNQSCKSNMPCLVPSTNIVECKQYKST